MPKFKMVVLSNPVEGRDEEYNDWYSDRHLQEVVAVPGFHAAQRFRLVDLMGREHKHRYLAIYEMDCEDSAAAVAELVRQSGAMFISEALDRETAHPGIYAPCSPVVTAGGA